jgi:hypothetical protein
MTMTRDDNTPDVNLNWGGSMDDATLKELGLDRFPELNLQAIEVIDSDWGRRDLFLFDEISTIMRLIRRGEGGDE